MRENKAREVKPCTKDRRGSFGFSKITFFLSAPKNTTGSERLLNESLTSKEGQELLALRDLFCFKMVPLREEKRWDVRRWEKEYAQVRDGEQRVEETLLDNSITAEASASVCLWGHV